MTWLKRRWDISRNWQLLYPVLGTVGLGYLSYKLAFLFEKSNRVLLIILSLVIFGLLLKATLLLFNVLEKRWKVDQRWKVIRIFVIFAITGSMSLVVTNPIFEAIGIVKSSFGTHILAIIAFYIIKFLLILPFYTILLVIFGWLLAEYNFFLNFAIKMANRFGFKKLTDKIAPKQ